MGYKYMILTAALMLAACSGDDANLRRGETDPVPVYLPVAPLNGAQTRAAVDEWNNTTVSLAYRTGTQPEYNENVNVVIKTKTNQAEHSPQIIHTGLQYPLDGSELYVRGYHPAASPDADGIVRYDISRGDVDLMCSGEVQGNQGNPIINDDAKVLLFRHRLTRLTFKMTCAQGHVFPERIAAMMLTGNAGQTYLPTQAELDLSDGTVEFRAPGTIMAGYKSDGFQVPAYGYTPAVIEAMVKPRSPLKIQILSTGDNFTDVSLANSKLDFLETNGGEEGVQYIINLTLYSASLLSYDIEIVDWEKVAMPDMPNTSNPWW